MGSGLTAVDRCVAALQSILGDYAVQTYFEFTFQEQTVKPIIEIYLYYRCTVCFRLKRWSSPRAGVTPKFIKEGYHVHTHVSGY